MEGRTERRAGFLCYCLGSWSKPHLKSNPGLFRYIINTFPLLFKSVWYDFIPCVSQRFLTERILPAQTGRQTWAIMGSGVCRKMKKTEALIEK